MIPFYRFPNSVFGTFLPCFRLRWPRPRSRGSGPQLFKNRYVAPREREREGRCKKGGISRKGLLREGKHDKGEARTLAELLFGPCGPVEPPTFTRQWYRHNACYLALGRLYECEGCPAFYKAPEPKRELCYGGVPTNINIGGVACAMSGTQYMMIAPPNTCLTPLGEDSFRNQPRR